MLGSGRALQDWEPLASCNSTAPAATLSEMVQGQFNLQKKEMQA
jgi:hypothetical protein